MPVLDLAAYKPVPATLGDANQIANGFQAIVNCINALDNNNFGAGKIFDPLKLMQDGAAAGQALVWSAAANGGTGGWVPGNVGLGGAVTVSTMAGGPPGSPADKDVWVATAVDGNGARWAFQYNAGSGSSFKWEFIGGSPVIASDTSGSARQNTVDNTWEFITGMPSVTLARAGQYRWRFGARIETTGATNQVFAGLAKTSTPTVFLLPVLDRIGDSESPNWDVQAAAADDVQQAVTRAAAEVVGMVLFSTPRLSVATIYPWIEVQPVRIS